MLALYAGQELSVGNWGFSYLVRTRALPHSLAGYTVSGYWLGLTLGRFLISPLAARAGLSTASLIYACLAGVTAAAALAWLAPAALAWLAGTIAQNTGLWVLLPFAIVLALAQFAVWRPIAARISQDERDQHLG
jgi:MFS family permease